MLDSNIQCKPTSAVWVNVGTDAVSISGHKRRWYLVDAVGPRVKSIRSHA